MTRDPINGGADRERAMAAATEAATHLVILLEPDGTVAFVNTVAERLLGYSPAQMVGNRLADFVHPDDQAVVARLLARAPEAIAFGGTSSAVSDELRVRHADGRIRTFEVDGTSLTGDPDVRGVLVIAKDRSARRRYEDALAALVESSSDASGYDALLDVLDAQLTGTASALYIGGESPMWVQHRLPAELCPPQGLGPWHAAIEQNENIIIEDFAAARELEVMSEELVYVASRAGYMACWCIAVPTPKLEDPPPPDGHESLASLVIWSSSFKRPPYDYEQVIAEIGELAEVALTRRKAELEVKWAATHDHLTGILNRTGLLALVEASNRTGAFVLIDLDGFRDVNDTYGHRVGDSTLKVLIERLARAVRGDDLVARLGGDEFVLFLPDATDRSATAAADRLIEVLGQPIVVEDTSISLSAGIGIDCSRDVSIDEQLDRADRSLYVAKRAGRGRIAIWAEEPAND